MSIRLIFLFMSTDVSTNGGDTGKAQKSCMEELACVEEEFLS